MRKRSRLVGRLTSTLLLLSPLLSVVPQHIHATVFEEAKLEGFGAQTPGGSGGTAYVVTSLADTGPGTLRDALSGSHRMVTFAVAGTIKLTSRLRTGSFVTIDGYRAPDPGVTITAASSSMPDPLLEIANQSDVVIRNLRLRDAPDPYSGYSILILNASNVVVDHCSMRRDNKDCLDITDGAHDITVQWSILAQSVRDALVHSGVKNLSLHHNLYVHGNERNPQLDNANRVDIVNNVVYDWAWNYGTRVRNYSSANLVKNYYLAGPRSRPQNAVVIESGSRVYSYGNVVPPGANANGQLLMPIPAPSVSETDAGQAFDQVLESAGAFPRDADDGSYVYDVQNLR